MGISSASSPRWRHKTLLATRMFTAAEGPRETGGWVPVRRSALYRRRAAARRARVPLRRMPPLGRRAWAATAARREHLSLSERRGLLWAPSPHSDAGARRGSCAECGASLFWDAPGRMTVSIGVGTLDDARDLELAGHVYASQAQPWEQPPDGAASYREELPAGRPATPLACIAFYADVRRPSSAAIGCKAAITLAMCSSSSSSSNSAPA